MSKKRVGIMTFHWATNYGAVLQAFALQTFLESEGAFVNIINYKPSRYDCSFLSSFKSKSICVFIGKIQELIKEAKIKKFRKANLKCTGRYYSLQDLQLDPPDCDVYIVGSDQVWNEYFLCNGDRTNKLTTSYFLDFGSESIKKMGYAVSFGCERYSDGLIKKIEYLVSQFSCISVRERTGINVLKQMSYTHGKIVCDPTVLLSRQAYSKFITINERRFTFIYLLRDTRNKLRASIKSALFKCDHDNEFVYSCCESIERWLSNIYNCSSIVTNSYHGMIFSILFNKNFIVVLEQNNPMNDRFFTLLDLLGLSKRIIYVNSVNTINNAMLKNTIDWEKVNLKLERFRKESIRYLMEQIEL